MADVNPIIKITNAEVHRGRNCVFQNLSLSINTGENTAIVGPNGAGKTTFLKLLARELYPAKGEVSILGNSVWHISELRKHFGVVSMDLQQNFRPHTPGHSVVLSGFFSSLNTFGHQKFSEAQLSIAEQVSNDLGIHRFRDTPFSKMSTGEQRRHLLARSLVHDPSVLVLDEPTNGLDLAAQFQYFRTVSHLISLGKTLVLVTHHLDEIPLEISRVILLKRGSIFADGPKELVLTQKNLSDLYELPVNVSVNDGLFHATPG
ncbi:ATP-binding cassette domain-containing protein [bacterium]|nr:ATP-binding cassette domain-containing protein [bacterium]